jgi:hypothetical protein
LAGKIAWAATHSQDMAQMGRRGRQEFEAKYTKDGNREMLLSVYRLAIDRAKERAVRSPRMMPSPS